MPRELIFTSVPSGLKPGSSGYCTVARHEDMDPMLERELERLSFYEMDGGLSPVIHAFRILRLQSGNHYVLSRICYSGSDHTGRTNYLAHHLVFDEAETHGLGGASPADYFLDTIGWLDEWSKGKQPVLFVQGEGEKAPYPASPPPASNSTWARITGDPLNAHEPIYRHSWRFITPDGGHTEPLSLISEFCSQPEVNVQWAWGTYTFTTFLQTSDLSGDFRCVAGPASGAVASVAHDTLHLGNPPATCFQTAGATTPGTLTPQHVPVLEQTPVEQATAAQSQDADRQTLEQSFVDEEEPVIESAPTSEEPAYETVENDLMSRYTQPKQDDVPDPSQADVRRATRTPFSGQPGSGTGPDLLTGKRSNLDVGLEEKPKSSKKFLIFSLTFVFLSILGATGYLFHGPIMKAFESTDDEEIAKGDEKGDDGKESKDSGSSEEDGEQKTNAGDTLLGQRKLATKAVKDAQTAFDDAEAAKEEANKAIEDFRPELKEEEPYKGSISKAAKAVTAAETALTEAKAAKDNADKAIDLKKATDAAVEARKKATEADKQKGFAEAAKSSVKGAIANAKEKKVEAAAAQANADVTLVPFKGDENLPVKIVFVEKLDVPGTDVFAWSTDQNKYDWMKPGKESEPLATRKEEKKKGETQFDPDVIVSATYQIKKRDKPVTIMAGSFSELRFKEGRKLHSEKFEAYKQVALEFKEHFNKSNFPTEVPLTKTRSRLINFIGEQEISVYPQHLEIIIGPERTNLAKTEFNSTLEDVEKMLKNLREKNKEKEQNEQNKARERIAKMLGKEVQKIKWYSNNPVIDATTQLKQHLKKVEEEKKIDGSTISIPAKFVKDINTINDDRLKAKIPDLKKVKAVFDKNWRESHGGQPPTASDEGKYLTAERVKIKDKFRKYAIKEIERFKDAGLEKAFAKDIAFNPAQAKANLASWTTVLTNLKEGSKKLEALEKSIFDPEQQAWQLKDAKTVLLEITP